MKFLLVTGSKSRSDTSQMLISEAKKYFDTVLVVPISKIRIELEKGETKVMYKETNLNKFDVCYLRIFAEDFVIGEIVMDALADAGVYIPGCLEAYQLSNNKYYTVKVLGEAGLPVPDSSLSVGQQVAVQISEKISFPIVIKLLSGFGGRGVMRVQNKAEFKPLLDTLRVLEEFLSAQQFIESKGIDLRCYVVGEEVYAVRRSAPAGEWRANISRGGDAQLAKINKEQKKIVLDAAKIIGMELGTIDLIESKGKTFIVEANFTPGLIIDFFGRKFARIFIRFLYDKARGYNTKKD